ncbi:zinc-finger domain-containing protein [Bhargavaea beijingensis]|uniref:Zinc-finger domain-containing protein n=1 Tax=Bhargavaea beijingensis TaxID=426756 RepID=A0ABX9ZB17_9BACL|nr:zinc-finger domain-containing protein [Bhargavaea beijingensis]RSK24818.1 zinc-finger domain-containing protein [Bhargavaea beijingensis]
MNKMDLIQDIDELLDQYCDGCFLKKQLRTEKGKATAHRFCIKQCTVGEQLRFLGSELNKLGQ